MSEKNKERCVEIGKFIVRNRCTVREASEAFSVGKSTVHRDVTLILPRVNIKLALKVKEILESHKRLGTRGDAVHEDIAERKKRIKKEMELMCIPKSKPMSISEKIAKRPEKLYKETFFINHESALVSNDL